MQIKTYLYDDIAFNYFFAKGVEREHYRNGSHFFFEGDTLYSWGTHFPLAVKCPSGYLLNGDHYSHNTAQHQGIARSAVDDISFFKSHIKSKKNLPGFIEEHNKQCESDYQKIDNSDHVDIPKHFKGAIRQLRFHHNKKECPVCQKLKKGHKSTHHAIIPFSALSGADINPESCIVLDVTEDTYETVKRKNPDTGEIEDFVIHHLGASLIRIGTRRYLSSLDFSSRRPMFYLVELKSRRGNTVEDAFRDLAGRLSDKQYKQYQLKEILRQGEYFLEPHPEIKTRELKKKARRTKKRVDGILDVKLKTKNTKKGIRAAINRYKHDNMAGYHYEQIGIFRQGNVPYYVLFDREHMGKKIPKSAIIEKDHLVEKTLMVHGFDLSMGIGNPHTARDMMQTGDGMFVRGTLRHPEHRMIRMGDTWHRVYGNTAVNSWTAKGNVD